MGIKVLIVDDHHLIRQGLKKLLNSHPELDVVGECGDGLESIEFCNRTAVDVVVMDLQMPRLGGSDAAIELRRTARNTSVVALSAYADGLTPEFARSWGLSGIVRKTDAFESLVLAIQTVARGGSYFESEHRSSRGLDSHSRPRVEGNSLTLREREVVALLTGGQSTKSAARTLGISPKTVETHRRNLMSKLNIDNLAELTKFAISQGMTACLPARNVPHRFQEIETQHLLS